MFLFLFFFSKATSTADIYTLSLHDALPIWPGARVADRLRPAPHGCGIEPRTVGRRALIGTRSHPDAPGAEQSLSDARDSSGASCITFSTARSEEHTSELQSRGHLV